MAKVGVEAAPMRVVVPLGCGELEVSVDAETGLVCFDTGEDSFYDVTPQEVHDAGTALVQLARRAGKVRAEVERAAAAGKEGAVAGQVVTDARGRSRPL